MDLEAVVKRKKDFPEATWYYDPCTFSWVRETFFSCTKEQFASLLRGGGIYQLVGFTWKEIEPSLTEGFIWWLKKGDQPGKGYAAFSNYVKGAPRGSVRFKP